MAMNNIRTYLLLFFSFLLGSCVTHYFTQPLPIDAETVNVMPSPILGKWVSGEEEVIIDKTSWTLNTIDSTGAKTSKLEFVIPDSLVVKKWRKNHYFNIAENDGYWTLYLGYKHKNLFYVKGLGGQDTLTLKNVLQIVPDTINKTQLFYSTPISKRQLRKFANKGGFCDTIMVFDLKNRTIVK